MYYLHQAFPDIIGIDATLRGFDYVLGPHPVNNVSYVSAVGTTSKLIRYGIHPGGQRRGLSDSMSTAPGNTRAVLLDLDGTLLDTAPDMVAALNQLLTERGSEPLPFAELRQLVSHGALALVRRGFPQAPGSVLEELRARFLEIYSDCLAVGTRPYEGIPAALARLQAAGVAWGIVTNKPGWLAEPLLDKLGLRDRAGVIVSGDTLAERKPHPGQLLYAAKALGLLPSQCIYVGDAERDVLAARAAGMEVFVAMFGYIPATEQPLSWPASGWLESPRALAALLDSIGR
jgi:N-acetyl-D-muramate 6-phosphate phosphatase